MLRTIPENFYEEWLARRYGSSDVISYLSLNGASFMIQLVSGLDIYNQNTTPYYMVYYINQASLNLDLVYPDIESGGWGLHHRHFFDDHEPWRYIGGAIIFSLMIQSRHEANAGTYDQLEALTERVELEIPAYREILDALRKIISEHFGELNNASMEVDLEKL